MKVSTIVVGVDGSASARSALEAAADMVADGGVVHVVTAYRVLSPREMSRVMASVPEELRSTFDQLAEQREHLEKAVAFLAECGVDHDGHFIADQPASAILDLANEVEADMIIVGNRGLSSSSRFVRGSVSSRVANHATTSFMVVHHDAETHRIA